MGRRGCSAALLAAPVFGAALLLTGCLSSSESDPPWVEFVSPSANSGLLEGEEVEFALWVADDNDDPASLRFSWESDRDGEIPGQTTVEGVTATMSWSGLTAGAHSIRVTVTDSDGGEGVALLPITVLAVSTVPSVEVVAPNKGEAGTAGREVQFLAEVQDADDLPETLVLQVTSDLQEESVCEGPGEAFGLASCVGILGAGVHQITFTVEDPSGQQGQAGLSFEVLADEDGDGWNVVEDCDDGDPTLNLDDIDQDTFTTCDEDCDDNNPDINPAAPEICDGLDNDCNGEADFGMEETWWGENPEGTDEDEDGSPVCADCDDNDPANTPGQPELCDGFDNDCDGVANFTGEDTDEDGDGSLACADCDDNDDEAFPGNNTEACDGKDNDCDGVVDDAPSDIFVKGEYDDSVHVWTSDGAGGFGSPTLLTPSPGHNVATALAGDFDGDGALDILVGRESTQGVEASIRVAAFFNNCGSTYDEVALQNNSSGFDVRPNYGIFGAADLDLDGDLDVVGWDVVGGNGYTWLNDGDGLSWSRNSAAQPTFNLNYWSTGGGGSVSLPLQDITGDSYPDIVECGPTNWAAPTNCTVQQGHGDGTFSAGQGTTFTVEQNVNGFAMADFDGDGALDYLGGFDDDGDAGQGWIWFGDPTDPAIYPSGPGTPAFDVTVPDNPLQWGFPDEDLPGWGFPYPYDWDGDGDMDVVVSVLNPMFSANRTLYLAENTGLASFVVSEIGPSIGSWGTVGTSELAQDILGIPVFP